MSRAQWRQLAHRIRACVATGRHATSIPPRLQLDLWAATDHRLAAETRRSKWL